MPRNKKAWKEAKAVVDQIVEQVRRMDNSICERKLDKREYAMMIGMLITVGPVVTAAAGRKV